MLFYSATAEKTTTTNTSLKGNYGYLLFVNVSTDCVNTFRGFVLYIL